MAILSTDPLPTPGLAVESTTLELKRELDSAFAAAKHIAALANARGGALVFGAVHNQQTGQLVNYLGIDVGQTDEAVSQAVKERCSPAPVYLASAREHEGKGVLVVNVEPTLSGALIGVRVPSKDPDYKGAAWVFPVRVGSQTKYLDPGELPMYIDARLRRAVVLLSQIGNQDQVRLVPERMSHGGGHPQPIDGTIGEINEAANSFRLNVERWPLDRIESVYHDGSAWIVVYRFFGVRNIG
jgi:hypothetical protein